FADLDSPHAPTLHVRCDLSWKHASSAWFLPARGRVVCSEVQGSGEAGFCGAWKSGISTVSTISTTIASSTVTRAVKERATSVHTAAASLCEAAAIGGTQGVPEVCK